MIYIGIDPGVSGAIVALDHDHKVRVCVRMPVLNIGKKGKTKNILDDAGVLAELRSIKAQAEHHGVATFTVLEKSQAMPGQGVTSMFNYGGVYHALKMALTAVELPFDVVHPRRWQKKILYGIEGGDTKMRAVLKVQRSLPLLALVPPRCRKPHEGIADAACMALYAKHLRTGSSG
jgi:hypothetical protein